MTKLLSVFSIKRMAALVVLLLLVIGFQLLRDSARTSLSAYFTNATGLYVGDDVRVLGVKVGKVTAIEPEGTKVLVTMSVNADEPIPPGANAAIVAPSLVSGRFVQLAPAWKSGPRMHDGTQIPLDRTTIPVSFDEVKKELTDLSVALGPGASSKNGALSQAISTIDTNLKAGDGAQLRASIAELRAAADTLSNGRSDLFTTVQNLNDFTRNIAINDAAVQGFTRELATVSGVLDTNRTQLTAAVRALGGALRAAGPFLKANRGTIEDSVKKTNTLSAVLADRSNQLAGVLHVAPTALNNLYNVIEDQAITGRASLANLDSVAQLLCGAILGVGGTAAQCQAALKPLLGLLGLDSLTNQDGLPAQSAVQAPAKAPVKTGEDTATGLGGLGALLDGLLGRSSGSRSPGEGGMLNLNRVRGAEQ